MKRIFIGVKVIPGTTLMKLISSFKAGLEKEKVRWTSTGNMHVTLAFPGNTPEEKIPAIDELLKKISSDHRRFEFNIKGSGVFKSMADPKVIWAGIENSGKLKELAGAVASGLRELGIELETRAFNPHITIGRLKRIENKDLLKKVLDNYQYFDIQSVQVNEIILYESILKPSGPVYTPQGIYQLASN